MQKDNTHFFLLQNKSTDINHLKSLTITQK